MKGKPHRKYIYMLDDIIQSLRMSERRSITEFGKKRAKREAKRISEEGSNLVDVNNKGQFRAKIELERIKAERRVKRMAIERVHFKK